MPSKESALELCTKLEVLLPSSTYPLWVLPIRALSGSLMKSPSFSEEEREKREGGEEIGEKEKEKEKEKEEEKEEEEEEEEEKQLVDHRKKMAKLFGQEVNEMCLLSKFDSKELTSFGEKKEREKGEEKSWFGVPNVPFGFVFFILKKTRGREEFFS